MNLTQKEIEEAKEVIAWREVAQSRQETIRHLLDKNEELGKDKESLVDELEELNREYVRVTNERDSR